ncbi:MAG: hypothetical protein KBT00_01445 [Bacteroidales bacterium]|nr:hypothetical protein [Candidatus Cacconaster merdequi]
MKRYLTILALSLLSIAAFAQEDGKNPVSRLSRDTILIGDQIEWIFDFQLAEGEELFLQEPEDHPVEGIETISKMTLDTLSVKRGIAEIEGRSIITGFDSGSFYLPQLIAIFQRNSGKLDTVLIDGPVLEVTVPPIDTATFELNDIKGQIKYPLTFKEAAFWFGMLLLLAAVVYLIWRFISYRRKNMSFFGKPVAADPPHIVALRSLEKTRAQKLWQAGKQKQFYTAVTDALRQYMSARYDIGAMEDTSAELFDDLKDKDIDPALFDRIKELFTTADYVKFAKHTASEAENEDAIPVAVKFVNDTYMQQVESESKETGKQDQQQ